MAESKKGSDLKAFPVGAGGNIVQYGDGIASIAAEAGHFWPTVWNDPANAELREARGLPEVLLPGDRVTVPPLKSKTVEVNAGARYIFRRRGIPSRVQMRLTKNGKPRCGVAYCLVVEGIIHTGVTDTDGWVRHWVPPTVRNGSLQIGDATVLQLRFGTLLPIIDERGVRQRLIHLDLLSTNAVLPRDLKTAVAVFQEAQRLNPSGDIDEATRSRLVAVHGS